MGELPLEIALDTQAVHSICENCHIVLVETDQLGANFTAQAENTALQQGADVISNSYGGTLEPDASSGVFDSYNDRGTPIVASSGDCGYPQVHFPASSPYVVAVGGTKLTLSSGNYGSETVWNDGVTTKCSPNDEGPGTACSGTYGSPSWQGAESNYALALCSGKRATADVSADAAPNPGAAIYLSSPYKPPGGSAITPNWTGVGGTSLAAPLVAGMFGLAGGDPSNVPYPAASIYAHQSATWRHDVTSGNNGSCGSKPICTAETGWDGPTGVGSPIGLTMFGTAEVSAPTLVTGAATALTPSSAVLNAIVDGHGSVTNWHFDVGPTAAYGSRTADARVVHFGADSTINVQVTGLTAGQTYHYRISATNQVGIRTGADAAFTVPTAPPPSGSSSSGNGSGGNSSGAGQGLPGGGGGGGGGSNVAVRCVVPTLKGKSTAAADQLLAAAHCDLGKITKPQNRRKRKKAKVVSRQAVAPGTVLAAGTTVAVTLGPEPRSRHRRRHR